MSNIPPSVPTIGKKETCCCMYEPMFIIFREIQVCSMQYLQWNTHSMQHECCELVFLKKTFSPTHSLNLGTMQMRMQNMNISGIPVHERWEVR